MVADEPLILIVPSLLALPSSINIPLAPFALLMVITAPSSLVIEAVLALLTVPSSDVVFLRIAIPIPLLASSIRPLFKPVPALTCKPVPFSPMAILPRFVTVPPWRVAIPKPSTLFTVIVAPSEFTKVGFKVLNSEFVPSPLIPNIP